MVMGFCMVYQKWMSLLRRGTGLEVCEIGTFQIMGGEAGKGNGVSLGVVGKKREFFWRDGNWDDGGRCAEGWGYSDFGDGGES